jgi:hypothetical protein
MAYNGMLGPSSSKPIIFSMTKFPFLETLNLLDLSHLTNDPVQNDLTSPTILDKLPLDISKFEGKAEEYLSNHVMSFHLCCYQTH